MSVDSITKSSPAAPARGAGRARAGLPPPRQRTRALTSRAPSARSASSEQRARASRAWFLGIVLGLLSLGLVGLLLLNTASAQDAFRLHDLQTRAADLSRQEQALSLQASVLADPGTLARRAGQLGMVPGGDPRFVAPGAPLPAGCQPVADGCVIRAPKPAPTPSPQPSPQPVPRPGQTHPAGKPTTSGGPAAAPKPAAPKPAAPKPAASSKPTTQPGASATATHSKSRTPPTTTPTPTTRRAARQPAAAPSPTPAPAPSRSAATSRRGAG